MLGKNDVSVLEVYKKLNKLGALSDHLKNPTTANLKKECVVCFLKRPNNEIKDILQSFAGSGNLILDAQHIGDIDPDKFRPLQNYIKGQIDNPSLQNIELLKWLIDYEKNRSVLAVSYLKNKQLILWSTGIVSVIFLAMGYFLFLHKQCMYWNGNQFIAVSCSSEEIEGVRVVALDERRLKKFQKTSRADTIGYKDLGNVWYMGTDSIPEFFTDSGMHPVDDRKQLKPITKYIIDKYILKKNTSDNTVPKVL